MRPVLLHLPPSKRRHREKGPRLKSREVAEQQLNKLRVEIDQDRADIQRPKELTFGQWVDRYEKIIEDRIRVGDLKAEDAAGLQRNAEARTARVR